MIKEDIVHKGNNREDLLLLLLSSSSNYLFGMAATAGGPDTPLLSHFQKFHQGNPARSPGELKNKILPACH